MRKGWDGGVSRWLAQAGQGHRCHNQDRCGATSWQAPKQSHQFYAPASLPPHVRAVYWPEAARPSGWKGEAPGGGTCATPYVPALLKVAAGPATLVPLVSEDRALAGPSGARLAPSSPARRQS